MNQQAAVFLIDLGDRASPFSRALKQVGRPAVVLTLEELDEALQHVAPLGIIAPLRHMSPIAERLSAAGATIPFFTLAPDGRGSLRPTAAAVTACVSEEIDPGILALRVQKALQHVGSMPPAASAAGIPSIPPSPASFAAPSATPAASAPPSAASAPPSARAPSVPARAPSAPPSARAPSVPAPAPSAPSAPSVPPAAVASTAPVAAATPQAAPAPSVPSQALSAPPLAGAVPEAAPFPSTVVPSTVGTEPASTHRPVAYSSEAPGALDAGEAVGRTLTKWGVVGISAAAVAAAGLGAFFFFGQGSETSPEANMASAEVAPSDAAARADQASPPSAGDTDSRGESAADDPSPTDAGVTDQGHATNSGSAPSPADNETSAAEGENNPTKEESSAASAVEGGGARFAIANPVSLPSCEERLDKTADDFSSTKAWRSAHSWKLARKNLMAGKVESAHTHMCESAFIDVSGPATLGLVKFYLGARDLDHAEAWARQAIDAAGSPSREREAKQLLGDVLIQRGQVEAAREVWLESFNLTEDDEGRIAAVCRSFVQGAVRARKGGDSALAERLLRRSVAFDDQNPSAVGLLASVLLQNEQPELARSWAEHALTLSPGLDVAEGVLAQLD